MTHASVAETLDPNIRREHTRRLARLGRIFRALRLAVPVAVLSAAPASAAFLAPVNLGTSQTEDRPAVAINARGDALLAWTDTTGTIVARTRSALGKLGPTLKLSGTGAHFPHAGIDASGNALVVWETGTFASARVQARAISSAGTLGPLQTLSAAGEEAHAPKLDVIGDGRAMVVFVSVDGVKYSIRSRTRSAAGVFAAAKTISAVGTDTFYPDVAMTEAGAALVAWQRSDGQADRIEARSVSSAGALGSIQILSAAGQSAQYPRVGIARSGAAAVAWQRSDGVHQRVQTRTRSAAGALGGVVTHSAVGKDALYFSMAANANGQVVVMWTLLGSSTSVVQARALNVAGASEPVQNISAAGQIATGGDVGVDDDGSAEIAFSGTVASHIRMQVRRRSASSALDRVETLSTAGANAYNPGVAVNPRGDAVIAWPLVGAPNQDDLVQASAGP